MSSISSECPSCGRQNIDLDKQCPCGFNYDKSFISELGKKGSDAVKSKAQKNIDGPKNNNYAKKVIIKEIDHGHSPFLKRTIVFILAHLRFKHLN